MATGQHELPFGHHVRLLGLDDLHRLLVLEARRHVPPLRPALPRSLAIRLEDEDDLPTAPFDQSFADRLLGVDPDLVDFSYGPETYDAIVIVALAAEIAGTDNPAQVAAFINGVTRDGEKCTSFADCKAIIEAGGDPDYDGPSGPQAFGPQGEPTEASFAILRYGDGTSSIDDSLTEYKFASIG